MRNICRALFARNWPTPAAARDPDVLMMRWTARGLAAALVLGGGTFALLFAWILAGARDQWLFTASQWTLRALYVAAALFVTATLRLAFRKRRNDSQARGDK